jgi:hypothetical protein
MTMTATVTPPLRWYATLEHPSPGLIARLAHEYGLRDKLTVGHRCGRWRLCAKTGEPCCCLRIAAASRSIGSLADPVEKGRYLCLATGLLVALRQYTNVASSIMTSSRLMRSLTPQPARSDHRGFGVAPRLSRERQSPEPPELVAGTLAYMAPEQTRRKIVRSIPGRRGHRYTPTTILLALTRRSGSAVAALLRPAAHSEAWSVLSPGRVPRAEVREQVLGKDERTGGPKGLFSQTDMSPVPVRDRNSTKSATIAVDCSKSRMRP